MTEYGSEFNWSSVCDYRSETALGLGIPNAEYYRSGRDALKALAQAGKNRAGHVLLPALCCESMIVPFTLNGYKVEFYKLTDTLRGDTGDVRQKLRDGSVLLYMPYLGAQPFEDAFLRSLKTEYNGIILAEDRTQDIIVPRAPGGFKPDAMLSSLRKWAAMPEGALLVTELEHPAGEPGPRFGELRRDAMEKKDKYFRSFQPELKAEFLAQLHTAESLLDEGATPCRMSEQSIEHLEHIDFARILERRRSNIDRLRERLTPLRDAGKLRFLTERPGDSTLYFPLLLENRSEIQHRMAEKGVYCPVIWPAPKETEGVCPVSRYVSEHMLSLMCDQRYAAADMDFIADTLIAALG